MSSKEHERLQAITDDQTGWRRWGPYVSDRSWGTVREDYSHDGDAWSFLPFDMARSKAYRWGEDAIAGFSDRFQLLCMAPVFWNGRDSILKERLFGLTPNEGNHGEDVKEYYFHADATPTHSYMKFIYKYPQAKFPYEDLIAENQRRGGQGFEHELLDTDAFYNDRYFDISIEFAKETPEELYYRITAVNRGPDTADLHILPHLWFRNIWSWEADPKQEPIILPGKENGNFMSLTADSSHVDLPRDMPETYSLGKRHFYLSPGGELLFTNNETNTQRVFGPDVKSKTPYVKDAFHRSIIGGEDCLNRERRGTKASAHYRFHAIPPGGTVVVRCRLSQDGNLSDPLKGVDALITKRKKEADKFYETIHPEKATPEDKKIQRQAFAGLLWTKQSYIYNVHTWLDGDNPQFPPPESRQKIRNSHWKHLNSMRILTMPDKWEYPWFAAWDLAFHCVGFALVDPIYAKEQLQLMLFEQFQHPSGQIPAYEWEFSDLNPPVHAWAVWRVYNMDRIRSGKGDREFLERCFHKLLINFAWWINKVDREGNNVFEGGFLGLDNITVVDRSEKCEDGSVLEQADATGWMGMFCLQLMRIALELAKENPVYEGLATKYFQHYTYVASAMKHMGNKNYQLWDEEDGFFYDVLRHPDGSFRKFRVRSLVGLIPLFAVERLEESWIKPFTEFKKNLDWFLENRKDLVEDVVHTVKENGQTTHVLTILNSHQITRIVERMWDPEEFLSPYGIRSLSRAHLHQPFEFDGKIVGYEPAEAICKLKGGNSNWRGPIWFPTNFLLIESLRKLGKAFGPNFTVASAGSEGEQMTMAAMACDLATRLQNIFRRGEDGQRPVYGGSEKFQNDPHWRELTLFYEYFHGDNGAGLGASHQTGWTALVANLIDEWCHEQDAK